MSSSPLLQKPFVPALDGLILVDKAPEATSFQAVKGIKKLLDVSKVGHTGTLDPLATGLLPICTGKATKLASIIMTYRKEYDVWARFGVSTDSHDRTGHKTDEKPWEHITEAKLREAMRHFLGEIPQIPPMHSAVKYQGRPLYWYAHKGIVLGNRKERTCTIHSFELLEFKPPLARFLVQSSHGTYVRTLVHDLGLRLESAATVEELRRTACGQFRVEQAVTLETLSKQTLEERRAQVMTMNDSLPEMPAYPVNGAVIERLRAGRTIMFSDLRQQRDNAETDADGFFKLTGPKGELVAVASFAEQQFGMANRVIKAVRIFS